MIERRRSARARVIYGGVIAYNGRQSTLDCVIRNFSPDGAKVEFHNSALLPDVIELQIAAKSRSFPAKISWRQANEAGLAFGSAEPDAPISLDWAADCASANPNAANCRARSPSCCPSTEWRSRPNHPK
jgi:hypothetical protein